MKNARINNISLMRSLRLAWLVFKKPHLFSASLWIDKAIIEGTIEAEMTITYNSGATRKISYTINLVEPKKVT